MREYTIAAIPGDGIGPEVVDAGLEVFRTLTKKVGGFQLKVETLPWGSHYYKKYGVRMPQNGLEVLRPFSAIYFGAVGAPDVPDHITLWGLRLAISPGLRPIRESSPHAHSARPHDCKPGAVDWAIVWAPASVQTISRAPATEAAADPHHFAVKQLSDYPHEGFLLVHREADGSPELHETQVDVFFVQSGSATLVVGGTLLNGETVAPHEKRNGTIQGGARQKLSAGDVVRIPARVPHQLVLDGEHEFTYLVVKVKGY
jgi:mannose-6-phosphate isomerase-like protein (cupin superfamily)